PASAHRFGAALLRAGDTAFRVREWIGLLARARGPDALSVQLALGHIATSARRGREQATLVAEVAPPAINAAHIAALEELARVAKPGLTPHELAEQLAAVGAAPPPYSIAQTVAAGGPGPAPLPHLTRG